jgi:quercetin dioxygenase-like cupin family protein
MTSWEGSVNSPPMTGETVDFMGSTLAFRLRGKDTKGKFSITDANFLPGAGPQFLHTHPAEETFIILEGEFELYGRVNGKKVAERAGPGHIHHVDGNAPHGIKNVGSAPGRALLMFHPADLQEAFFAEVGAPSTPKSAPLPVRGPPPPDVQAKNAAAMQKHHIVFLEHPPG